MSMLKLKEMLHSNRKRYLLIMKSCLLDVDENAMGYQNVAGLSLSGYKSAMKKTHK